MTTITATRQHSYNHNDRCDYCDCRPWGKWAMLPCGAGSDPAYADLPDMDWQTFITRANDYRAAKYGA